jgi:hypothetical protein
MGLYVQLLSRTATHCAEIFVYDHAARPARSSLGQAVSENAAQDGQNSVYKLTRYRDPLPSPTMPTPPQPLHGSEVMQRYEETLASRWGQKKVRWRRNTMGQRKSAARATVFAATLRLVAFASQITQV